MAERADVDRAVDDDSRSGHKLVRSTCRISCRYLVYASRYLHGKRIPMFCEEHDAGSGTDKYGYAGFDRKSANDLQRRNADGYFQYCGRNRTFGQRDIISVAKQHDRMFGPVDNSSRRDDTYIASGRIGCYDLL